MDIEIELIEKIKWMKKSSPEELFRITIYSIENYVKSLIVFGRNSNITKENINIIKEMAKILKIERKLLNYILKNINIIDLESALDIVYLLDDLNEKTYMNYDSILNNIDIACELKNDSRILKPNKGFDTLLSNPNYENMVLSLTENK